MINFVNTEIVDDNSRIGIGVYYIDFDKANNLISKLIGEENIIEDKNSSKNREVRLIKNNVEVRIYTLPSLDSSRGYKHNYSLIDKNLFVLDNGYEFFNTRIMASTVNYNLKDEYKFNDNELRFMLY